MKKQPIQNETFKLGKNGKIALWVGAGVVTAGAVWFFFIRKKEESNPDVTTPTSSTPSGGSARRFSCRYKGFPLRFGSCGSEVSALQKKLNKKGAGLNVDGKFGPNTESAAKRLALRSTFTQMQLNSLT